MLRRIAKATPNATNAASLVEAVNEYGAKIGLDQPHRLAQFVPQTMHESGGLKYNKEIWGPTAAQKRYEGRKDLGNTQKGDGSKYRGYGLLQVTGRANVTAFYKWCVAKGMNPPNFIEKPELIATAPWSAVSALWYWDTRNLNKLADRGDNENITRSINGGLNGYDDRLSYYDRTALVFLGYAVNELTKFQKDHGLAADGLSGPLTRAEMHKALVALTDKPSLAKTVQAAPVVEEKKVPVKLGNPDKPWYQSKSLAALGVTGTTVTTAVASVGTIPWQNLIVLVVAAFVALGAFMIWSRIQDRKKQAEKAEALKS
ncbi:glycoside hydrolase family 19 protein [Phyllobacterium sp. BT25]|uniref:Glycoside hydrolase family 19 protein n=2 Tax=Phyllobacterium pellucidum TaxID=2740464 RepID=A0A849VNP2_9HYPH|nr:glycoside hydrolase family 19 protein [Phyllobacterium pellucidum]